MRFRRLILLLPAVALTACGIPAGTPLPGPSPWAPPATAEADLFGSGDIIAPVVLAEGTFGTTGTTAVTYDAGLVPPGATALLTSFPVPGGLAVRLSATGMVPRHMYGAHLHTRPCTARPDDAGPHYRHDGGPAAPAPAPASRASGSPASAPPASTEPEAPGGGADGEVWLDFTADGDGKASVTSVQDRPFDEASPPRSLVVHAGRTRTAGGTGPDAARVACLTVRPG